MEVNMSYLTISILSIMVGIFIGVRLRPYLERRYYELRRSVRESDNGAGEEVRRRFESAIDSTFGRGQSGRFKTRKANDAEVYNDGSIIVLAED